jgi:uncharacterized protein YbbK (DUF523 family)
VSTQPVLVSACLLGERCRYDGGDKRAGSLIAALEENGVEAVPFCPEEAGGLGTPRPPCSIEGGDGAAVLDGAARVLDDTGRDRTDEFLKGARLALEAARTRGCRHAYLKEHSPSCGTAQTTTPTGRSEGRGVTAELLFRNGIALISVD